MAEPVKVTDPELIARLDALATAPQVGNVNAAAQAEGRNQRIASDTGTQASSLLAPSGVPVIPTDTPTDTVDEQAAQPVTPAPVQDQETIDRLDAAPHTEEGWWEDPINSSRAILDGLWFGWSDEIGAAVAAAAIKATGAEGSDRPYNEIRQEMTRQLESERQGYNEAHPGASLGLNIAGGVLSPFNKLVPGLAGKAIPRTAPVGQVEPLMTRTARTIGIGTTEGAIAGAGYGQEGDKTQGAMIGAGFGAAIPAAVGAVRGVVGAATRRNIQEALDTSEGFKPIVVAANNEDQVENLIANIYRTVIGKALGGATMMRQQTSKWVTPLLDSIEDQKVQLRNLKRDAKLAVASVKKQTSRMVQDLRGSLNQAVQRGQTVIKSQARQAEQLVQRENLRRATQQMDDLMGDLERNFRVRALRESVPEGATQKEINDVLNSTSLNEATRKLDALWDKYGFNMIKKRSFRIKISDVVAKVEEAVGGLSGLVGNQGIRAADIINSMLERIVSTRGIVSGEDLSALRSEIGAAASKTSDIYTSQTLAELQSVINDVIERQLSGDDLAAFMAQRDQWGFMRTLQGAVTSASTEAGKRGAFSPNQWLASVQRNSSVKARRGNGVLQEEANEVAEDIASGNRAIQEAADAQLEADIATLQRQFEADIAAEEARINRLQAENTSIIRQGQDSAEATVRKAQNEEAITQAEARLKATRERLQEITDVIPRENATLFEKLFATRLVQQAMQFSVMGGMGLLGGVPGLLAAPAVVRGLMSEGAQRVVAGQTSFQEAVQRGLQSAATQTDSALVRGTSRGAGGSVASQPVISKDVIPSIMRQSPRRKAAIYTTLQNQGKLEALQTQEPELYAELRRAYEASQ